jgi:altronate dehydratase large subunit
MAEFLGYVRPNGTVGTRNWVLVIPGGFLAAQIASTVCGVRHINNIDTGSGRTHRDKQTLARFLTGLAMNPNVASVIIQQDAINLGTTEIASDVLAEAIAQSGKRVEMALAAREKGTMKALTRGIELAQEMVFEASRLRREPVDESYLTVGVKCGMSDATSGVAGNPAVGAALDRIAEAGGTVLFGETTEVIGAEHIIARRAKDPAVAKAFLEMVEITEARSKAVGEDIRGTNPGPSNIDGGLSTLEEKSLGAIHKVGTSPLMGVLRYAERPSLRGLHFMDSWQTYSSILPGFAAAGATLTIFQLGGETIPEGAALSPSPAVVAPLVWSTGNPQTSRRCRTSIDFSSAAVLDGEETIQQAGNRLHGLLLNIASGTMTRCEPLAYLAPVMPYTLDVPF